MAGPDTQRLATGQRKSSARRPRHQSSYSRQHVKTAKEARADSSAQDFSGEFVHILGKP